MNEHIQSGIYDLAQTASGEITRRTQIIIHIYKLTCGSLSRLKTISTLAQLFVNSDVYNVGVQGPWLISENFLIHCPQSGHGDFIQTPVLFKVQGC